jgi:hypothetical protein
MYALVAVQEASLVIFDIFITLFVYILYQNEFVVAAELVNEYQAVSVVVGQLDVQLLPFHTLLPLVVVSFVLYATPK